jgi:hypothetical protein
MNPGVRRDDSKLCGCTAVTAIRAGASLAARLSVSSTRFSPE